MADGEAGARRKRFLGTPLGNAVVVVVTAAVIAAGVWALNASNREAPPGATAAADGVSQLDIELDGSGAPPKVGEPAPDFSGVTVDGRAVSLMDLRGKGVWIVFGETWCANCRAEAPDVRDVAADYADDVEVVSVYVGESSSAVTAYADRLGLVAPQIADPSSRIGAAYGVLGIPAHYFIDAGGVVRDIRVGILTPTQAEQQITALAAPTAAP
jgi:peroxiredoxin